MISEADIEAFTYGDCHILARELSQVTGWPICAFCAEDEPDIHAFVRTPTGEYLDITGCYSPDTFGANWSHFFDGEDPPYPVIETTYGEILDCWDRVEDYEMFPDSKQRARELAGIVIDFYRNPA